MIIGLQGGVKAELNIGVLLAKRATVTATSLRARTRADKARVVAGTVAFAWPLIDTGQVRPIIDRVLTLDDAAEAHRVLEGSTHIGKVLLRVQ